MKPEPLPRVPCPPEHHWRHFRVHVIPRAACMVVLGFAVWLWGKNLASPVAMSQAGDAHSTPAIVHVVPVKSSLAHGPDKSSRPPRLKSSS